MISEGSCDTEDTFMWHFHYKISLYFHHNKIENSYLKLRKYYTILVFLLDVIKNKKNKK